MKRVMIITDNDHFLTDDWLLPPRSTGRFEMRSFSQKYFKTKILHVEKLRRGLYLPMLYSSGRQRKPAVLLVEFFGRRAPGRRIDKEGLVAHGDP